MKSKTRSEIYQVPAVHKKRGVLMDPLLSDMRKDDSILFFVLLHATILPHITIESDEYSLTVSD